MIFMTIWLVASAYLHLVFSANQSVKPKSMPTLSCTASGGSRNGVPGVPGVPGLNGRDGAKGDRGSVGAPGKMGPKGTTGTKGEQGAKGEQGTQVLGQKNWKQCAWKNVNDDRDSGLVKNCKFIKHADDTALKVEFNGDYRLSFCLHCCNRWYFTFNGVECRGPLAIDAVVHINVNHGRKDTNIHRTTQIGGYCEGISKGNVQVGFHVGKCHGGYKTGDALTGWNSVTRIMIEEVPPPQK